MSGNGSGVSWDGGSAAEMGVSSDIFSTFEVEFEGLKLKCVDRKSVV